MTKFTFNHLIIPPAPSKAVENLHVVPITPSSVRVQWTPLGDAHWSGDTRTGGYRVRYQPLTDFPTALQQAMKQEVPGIKVITIIGQLTHAHLITN